jgi:hypothetical protein
MSGVYGRVRPWSQDSIGMAIFVSMEIFSVVPDDKSIGIRSGGFYVCFGQLGEDIVRDIIFKMNGFDVNTVDTRKDFQWDIHVINQQQNPIKIVSL